MRVRCLAVLVALLLLPSLASAGTERSSDEGGPAGETPKSREATWNQGPLGRQAKRLQDLYADLGSVERHRPRLLDQTDAFPIVLDPRQLNPASEDCLTVTVLGSPNLSFLMLFQDELESPARRAWPIPSAAGAAEVTRCGARKSLLEGLSVKLRSRRGVLEFLVLRSQQPPPPVGELLAGRNPGANLPSPQVGRRPWLAPLEQRLEEAIRHGHENGAEIVGPSGVKADVTGRGSSVLHLTEGCHRIFLLAESDPEAPPDLDARLYRLTQGEELTTDEEHSGQVTLTHCVGRADRVRLDFSGATPHGEVTVLQARWPIPEGLPVSWGPHSRARLAQTVFRDDLPQLPDPPVFAALGVRGVTTVRVETDPDACYVAVLSTIKGDATNMALAVAVGGTLHDATLDRDEPGVTTSFCAKGSDQVTMDVQVLGSGLAWIVGIWQLSGAGP